MRDRSGVPQIDAVVQLLRLDASVVALARTDEHGVFSMPHLLPGTYQLRATENSFMPALRDRIHVTPQQHTIANITLSTLLDTADWLPAKRRQPTEAPDDWKWTLRASANRPLLRFADDADDVSQAAESRGTAPSLRLIFDGGAHTFGQGGPQTTFEMRHDSAEGQAMLLRAATGAMGGGASEFTAGFVEPLGPGRTLRTVASVLNQQVDGTGMGQDLETMLLRTAESAQIAPQWMAELGNELEAVRLRGPAATEQIASHPFGSLTWTSASSTVSYSFATARGAQHAEELASRESLTPVATIAQGHLGTERGLHQEIRFSRRASSNGAEITFAAFDDTIVHPAITGGGALAAQQAADGDFLYDQASNALLAQGPGYGGFGWMTAASARLRPMLLSVEYADGPALFAPDADQGPVTVEHALRALHGRRAQSATIAASGSIPTTGTRWRTSYRWQPSRSLTAVDPYDSSLRDAYLNLLLRQPMHIGKIFPGGMEALVDVRNLLAQGYYPFLTADGSTLYFAQMDRSIQGGIAFTF